MKAFLKSTVTVLALGGLMFGCQPEQVAPKENNQPTLGAYGENEHPMMTNICSGVTGINLISEDGSQTVNYCGFLPCVGPQPQWGTVNIYNNKDTMAADITMAAGWMIDASKSYFSIASNFSFSSNGIPVANNDYRSVDVNPLVNTWQLRITSHEISMDNQNCFYAAINLTVVKVSFFGGAMAGSQRQLWGRYAGWNNNEGQPTSPSPFLTPLCWAQCAPVWPAAEQVCVTNYYGLPGNNSCTTIVPDVTGATGALTYEWASGETSPSLTVCPTANTTYTVSVTDENGPFKVYEYNVNTFNADCTPGNRPHPKVKVCHVPPGNPGNAHSICIDWSAVPAHVLRFRLPAPLGNPNQGHDSGCEIGECGSNPCL